MKSLNQIYSSINNLNTTKKLRINLISTSTLFYIILSLALFTACSNDDSIDPIDDIDDPVVTINLPTVELISGSEEVNKGVIGAPGIGSLQYTVKGIAPEGFSQLVIYRVIDGVKAEYQTIDDTHPDYVAGSNNFSYELGYIFTDIDADKEVYFIAEVWDILDNKETLNFAEAIVKKPMIKKSSIELSTSIPGEYNEVFYNYLYINGSSIVEQAGYDATTEDNDYYISAILSYNDQSNLYLASATDVDEADITDSLLEISRTKFKYSGISENNLEDDFNIFDVFQVENNYDEILFGQNEERIHNLVVGNRIYLKTWDDRKAVLQIKNIETDQDETYALVTLDLFITQ